MVSIERWFHVTIAWMGLVLALGCDQSPQPAGGAASATGVSQAEGDDAPKPPPRLAASQQPRAPGAAPAWLGEYVDRDP